MTNSSETSGSASALLSSARSWSGARRPARRSSTSSPLSPLHDKSRAQNADTLPAGTRCPAISPASSPPGRGSWMRGHPDPPPVPGENRPGTLARAIFTEDLRALGRARPAPSDVPVRRRPGRCRGRAGTPGAWAPRFKTKRITWRDGETSGVITERRIHAHSPGIHPEERHAQIIYYESQCPRPSPLPADQHVNLDAALVGADADDRGHAHPDRLLERHRAPYLDRAMLN